MNNKILFMIINQDIKYLENNNMDHREWYLSMGYPPDTFESIIRGVIIDNKIIFYKGINYQYDEDVIQAACKYTYNIRNKCNNQSLQVYCGLLLNGDNKLEPILNLKDSDIQEYNNKLEQERINKQNNNTNNTYVDPGPLVEFNNNYEDENFINEAVKFSKITIIINIIVKILLFIQDRTLHLDSKLDILLVIAQTGLLVYCMIGYKSKKENTKYLGILASILIILTFDIIDIILGITYFLFTINLEYIKNIKGIITNLIQKIKNINKKKEK